MDGPVAANNALLSRNHRRLGDSAARTVSDLVASRDFACATCGAGHFTVGDALEMGSIWPDEELGTYMIALTCQDCGTRTGIRLTETQFRTSGSKPTP